MRKHRIFVVRLFRPNIKLIDVDVDVVPTTTVFFSTQIELFLSSFVCVCLFMSNLQRAVHFLSNASIRIYHLHSIWPTFAPDMYYIKRFAIFQPLFHAIFCSVVSCCMHRILFMHACFQFKF